ncbi:class I SAM-dependent methyltransferase [Gemmatimonadota bacterium]
MADHCCPWWMNYLIGNPLRLWLQPPEKLFGHLVKPGMIVLDAGCGMGVFTLALAALAGAEGKVVAVDLDAKNLAVLERKARRKGLEQRITTVACDMGELPLDYRFDFALAANSVHEVPGFQRFFLRLHALLNSGAKFLLLEPRFHIGEKDFQRELDLAAEAGLETIERSSGRSGRKALLEKK